MYNFETLDIPYNFVVIQLELMVFLFSVCVVSNARPRTRNARTRYQSV